MIRGDSREVLADLDPLGAQTIVTSPPYLAQRRYGDDDREIGRDEQTVDRYVEALVLIFRLCARHLTPTGSVWLNIGDKANNSGGAGGDWKPTPTRVKGRGGKRGHFRDRNYPDGTFLDVPGAVVGALIADGWRLRMPIVWDQGRQSPEDLRHVRRPRWSHEMIYLLTRSDRMTFYPSGLVETGSVWHFPPGGDGDPHLAPFPNELARRCILASTLPGDLVLDPFAGSGTVDRVATSLGRHSIGIDLYAEPT